MIRLFVAGVVMYIIILMGVHAISNISRSAITPPIIEIKKRR
jgi:hypothetical protein